jgi:hypothetical protein
MILLFSTLMYDISHDYLIENDLRACPEKPLNTLHKSDFSLIDQQLYFIF